MATSRWVVKTTGSGNYWQPPITIEEAESPINNSAFIDPQSYWQIERGEYRCKPKSGKTACFYRVPKDSGRAPPAIALRSKCSSASGAKRAELSCSALFVSGERNGT